MSKQIGAALALKLARAVCGDDHLICAWPNCGCKSTKRKINAVALVVSDHLGAIECKIQAAFASPSPSEAAPASAGKRETRGEI